MLSHVYHKAMTETNSWAARSVSFIGLGKTALHRERGGMREVQKDVGERGLNRNGYIPEKPWLRGRKTSFVCAVWLKG